jgi:hypothetical protein
MLYTLPAAKLAREYWNSFSSSSTTMSEGWIWI